MAGSSSFGARPPGAMRNLIAATGFGGGETEVPDPAGFQQCQQHLEPVSVGGPGSGSLSKCAEMRRYLAQGGYSRCRRESDGFPWPKLLFDGFRVHRIELGVRANELHANRPVAPGSDMPAKQSGDNRCPRC